MKIKVCVQIIVFHIKKRYFEISVFEISRVDYIPNKNMQLQSIVLQVLVVGPLPSLFEWWPWGPKWPCGGQVLGSKMKYTSKSSSPELLGSGA